MDYKKWPQYKYKVVLIHDFSSTSTGSSCKPSLASRGDSKDSLGVSVNVGVRGGARDGAASLNDKSDMMGGGPSSIVGGGVVGGTDYFDDDCFVLDEFDAARNLDGFR